MKTILLSILSILVLLAIIIGILELSSSYTPSTNIHKDAPVITVQTISIKAKPKEVYAIMADVNHWADWQSDIKNPTLKDSFQEGSSFDWQSGGLTIHSTIHTADPNKKIGWSGTAFGAFAIHNWTFTPKNGYTEVTVEESMEGWLVKLMPKKFQTGLEQSLQLWLDNLKIEAEK